MKAGMWVMLVATALSSASGTDADPKSWRNERDGMLFVWVPPGSFMGEVTDGQPGSGKYCRERITLEKGYWMGRTEVTVGQFRRFAEATRYTTDAERAGRRLTWRNPGFEQSDDHPVVLVSLEDARRYCQWAQVELPTDAEWFHACRGGADTLFYWGDQMDGRHAWHRGNSGDGTRAVATRLPNGYGLHDMIGNVYEWCASGGDVGISRGGSWARCDRYLHVNGDWVEPFAYEVNLRIHDGSPVLMYPWDDDRGFRCVRREK